MRNPLKMKYNSKKKSPSAIHKITRYFRPLTQFTRFFWKGPPTPQGGGGNLTSASQKYRVITPMPPHKNLGFWTLSGGVNSNSTVVESHP